MKLAYYRNLCKMTQQDVAMVSGISIQQIQDIEAGKVNIRCIHADTAIRLANAFGISVEELMGVIYTMDDGRILYESEFIPFTPNSQGSSNDID